jgi:hypothetical protein
MVNFVWRERWLNRRCLRSLKKHLFAVWILRCISRVTSFVGVIRDPRYTNFLRLPSVCRQLPRFAPRYESSYHSGPQSYILSFVLFLTQLWLLLFSMICKHSKRLTDSYRRYLYHRHRRVVVFLARCNTVRCLIIIVYIHFSNFSGEPKNKFSQTPF